MFWNRKVKTERIALGLLEIPPMPAKKQFSTMLELLRDAEKYDTEGELGISKKILNDLRDYIESYQNKGVPK